MVSIMQLLIRISKSPIRSILRMILDSFCQGDNINSNKNVLSFTGKKKKKISVKFNLRPSKTIKYKHNMLKGQLSS